MLTRPLLIALLGGAALVATVVTIAQLSERTDGTKNIACIEDPAVIGKKQASLNSKVDLRSGTRQHFRLTFGKRGYMLPVPIPLSDAGYHAA